MFFYLLQVGFYFCLTILALFIVCYTVGAGFTKGKMDAMYDMAKKGFISIERKDEDE